MTKENDPPGSLHLSLEGRSGEYRLSLSPRDLSHLGLLEGVEEGISLLRLRALFHLCGKAQERLALLALKAARGEETGGPFFDGELLQESLSESVRALLLPVAGENPPSLSETRMWTKLRDLGRVSSGPTRDFFREFRELLEGFVLGESVSRFLARKSEGDWEDWIRTSRDLSPVARRAGRFTPDADAAVRLLPALRLIGGEETDRLARRLDEVDFLASPRLDEEGRETGPLARMEGHPLVAALSGCGRSLSSRLAARLTELSLWSGGEEAPGEMSASLGKITSRSLGRGEAIAWGETARGLLVHRWTKRERTVSKVRILAPTEWTFAPEGGSFAEWFSVVSRKEGCRTNLRKTVSLALWVFDPCAPVVVREASPGQKTEGKNA